MCCSSLIFCSKIFFNIFLDFFSMVFHSAFVSCTKWDNWKGIFHSKTCGRNKYGKCSSFCFFFKFHIYKVVRHNLRVKRLLAGIALKAASCMLNMLKLHFLHLKQCWESWSRRASHFCLQPPQSGSSCLCLIHQRPGKREHRFLDVNLSSYSKWICLRPK